MKRILLLYIMVLLLPSLCRAQITYFVEANSKLEADNDFWFNDVGNRGGEGIVLDGVFIKSGIGIDWHLVENADTSLCPVRYPVWIKGVGNRNDSVWLACSPGKTKEGYVMIGGMKCSILSFFHYMKEDYKLVSLEDIRKKDFPDVKGNVVYMINKFFIMKDVDLYKLDDDFIQHIELVESKDIEALKNNKPFTIIRIFTRSLHNRMTGFSSFYDQK